MPTPENISIALAMIIKSNAPKTPKPLRLVAQKPAPLKLSRPLTANERTLVSSLPYDAVIDLAAIALLANSK